MNQVGPGQVWTTGTSKDALSRWLLVMFLSFRFFTSSPFLKLCLCSEISSTWRFRSQTGNEILNTPRAAYCQAVELQVFSCTLITIVEPGCPEEKTMPFLMSSESMANVSPATLSPRSFKDRPCAISLHKDSHQLPRNIVLGPHQVGHLDM